jgi:uncharacterized membrane protein YidH (DUF202 family)
VSEHHAAAGPPPGPRRGSLAAERTALAWHRTAVAALVGELAVLKASASGARAFVSATVSVALLALIVGCEVGSWHRARGERPPSALAPGRLRAVGIIVAVVAAGAIALALVPSS